MRDGYLKNDEESQLRIIEQIRQYQPDIVLCNAPSDRHPDHGNTSSLVSDACILSGLRKIETAFNGKKQESWRPKLVYKYIQFYPLQPDLVVDISGFFT